MGNYVLDVDAQYAVGLAFEGFAASFVYDKSGALKSASRETDWDAGIGGWRNQVLTTYGYDGAGRDVQRPRYCTGHSWQPIPVKLLPGPLPRSAAAIRDSLAPRTGSTKRALLG